MAALLTLLAVAAGARAAPKVPPVPPLPPGSGQANDIWLRTRVLRGRVSSVLKPQNRLGRRSGRAESASVENAEG